MLQVDSLTFVLISELTVGLLVVVVVYLVWLLGRKNREQAAVRVFIERLKATEEQRLTELKERLRELTSATEEQLDLALDEFSLQEKTLYKQIIQVYLQHNIDAVVAVDSRVRAIIEPFCTLLAESKGSDDALLEDLRKAREMVEEQNHRIKQVAFESSQLAEQLNTALETLDEVSGEYSKMFGESKSAEELEVSQKRILNVFRQAEQKVKQTNRNKDDSDSEGEAH